MPDLLLELFSEEIPARMQRKAAEDLRRLVTDALVEQGFLYEGARAFATPRRIALHVAGLPAKGKDVREERKGPRVGAPEAAIQGFLKSAGLTDIAQATIQSDPKKGDSYVAVIERPGRPTPDAIAGIVPAIVRAFPWPKSMRWGAASAAGASLRWVRPLHSILCTFGPETEEPEIVRFEVDGIHSGDVTFGHRFLSNGQPIRVRRLEDYVAKLEAAHVLLDADRRKAVILNEARNLAFAQGLELIEDEGLLEEVAGLVEWPTVLMGSFDADFLQIPAEVIRATIRANQKCFVLRDGKGALSNRFLLVSNQIAPDGGRAIVAGNERVVRARLSDALHFWKTDQRALPDVETLKGSAESLGLDLAKPLDQRMARLDHLGVVFHEKLGTQGERVRRIAALARELAKATGADPELCARAALLAKADLQTEVVGEFPELQGFMGRRYAELQGEDKRVFGAIEDHYKPLGPSDRVPNDPVAVTVALADKLDTLVGFWAIDEKPTGSKDPYALRRAALGVIRLVVENGVRLGLLDAARDALAQRLVRGAGWFRRIFHEESGTSIYQALLAFEAKFGFAFRYIARSKIDREVVFLLAAHKEDFAVGSTIEDMLESAYSVIDQDEGDLGISKEAALPAVHAVRERAVQLENLQKITPIYNGLGWLRRLDQETRMLGWEPYRQVGEVYLYCTKIGDDLLSFFHDRLKVMLKDQGARHDLVDAVLAANAASNDDLLLVVRRVEALTAFLATEDGANLLAGYKRAANILRAEEKKDGEGAFAGAADPALLAEPQEKALHAALGEALPEAQAAAAGERYGEALAALSCLRAPVDAFFDKVTVNAPDPALRANRLRLLSTLRAATLAVADFGKIAG